MNKFNKEWQQEKLIKEAIRGAIESYLKGYKKRCTLNWTAGYIKQRMQYGITKQELMGILDVFIQYKNNDRYIALIGRLKQDKLI